MQLFVPCFPVFRPTTSELSLASRLPLSVASSWRNSSDNAYVGPLKSNDTYVVVFDIRGVKQPSKTTQIRDNSLTISPRSVSSRVLPTGTDVLTTQPIPTDLVLATTARANSSAPTTLPKVISPPNGIPPQPANSTMVALGFGYSLNYAFITQSPVSVEQAFAFLASVLAQGLNIPDDEVVVQSLQPLDTSREIGYITALAFIYTPTKTISTLRLRLLDPNSPFFHSENPENRALMQSIDFSISEVPAGSCDPYDDDCKPSGTSAQDIGYVLSQNRFFALNAWFARAFNGTVSQSYDLLRGSLWSLDQVTASSDLLLAMYSNGHDMPTSLDNLAISISNYIRSSGGSFGRHDNHSAMALGKAFDTETYVHVRWAWLTLPVVCVVSASLFLLSAILETRRRGALVWKSSMLPYLFYGLDWPLSEAKMRAGEVTEMEHAAGQVKARLGRDGNGNWKLLRVGRIVEMTNGRGGSVVERDTLAD